MSAAAVSGRIGTPQLGIWLLLYGLAAALWSVWAGTENALQEIAQAVALAAPSLLATGLCWRRRRQERATPGYGWLIWWLLGAGVGLLGGLYTAQMVFQATGGPAAGLVLPLAICYPVLLAGLLLEPGPLSEKPWAALFDAFMATACALTVVVHLILEPLLPALPQAAPERWTVVMLLAGDVTLIAGAALAQMGHWRRRPRPRGLALAAAGVGILGIADGARLVLNLAGDARLADWFGFGWVVGVVMVVMAACREPGPPATAPVDLHPLAESLARPVHCGAVTLGTLLTIGALDLILHGHVRPGALSGGVLLLTLLGLRLVAGFLDLRSRLEQSHWQRHRAERDAELLGQEKRRLATVNALGRELNASLELNQVLQVALCRSLTEVSADFGAIRTSPVDGMHPDGGILCLPEARREEALLYLEDQQPDAALDSTAPYLLRQALQDRDETVSELLLARQERPFDPAERWLLTAMAAEISLALRNSRNYLLARRQADHDSLTGLLTTVLSCSTWPRRSTAPAAPAGRCRS
ncbi:MAG: hypothetical protein HY320_01110 [Armatimonadetes bacterium]|nr:hypothetical protein [Armatimonadota bacterium]